MTLDQVKSDLKEIQYYYEKQKELDGASRTIGASKITRKSNCITKRFEMRP